jgi:hypothetical protein
VTWPEYGGSDYFDGYNKGFDDGLRDGAAIAAIAAIAAGIIALGLWARRWGSLAGPCPDSSCARHVGDDKENQGCILCGATLWDERGEP